MMSLVQKVVWNEGMALCPQHFQQWDRYQHSLLNFRIGAMAPHAWGLTRLAINQESLQNGDCVIEDCAGIFPDGLAFEFSDENKKRAGRTVERKHLIENRVDVHVVVPREVLQGVNCSISNGKANHQARFHSTRMSVGDETAERKMHDILVTETNLGILFSGEQEVLGNHISIKVAELEPAPAGFVLSADYIPPCLTTSSSQELQRIIANLRAKLSEQSKALTSKLGQRSQSLVDISTTDLATFWPLYTVNSFLPLLAYAEGGGTLHPEQVYMILAQLDGALSSFAIDQEQGISRMSEAIPLYQHKDLRATFKALYLRIMDMLDIGHPSNYVEIPLEPTQDGFLKGLIYDDRLFDGGHFFLAISADMPDHQLASEVEQNVKVGALDDIPELIRMALRGVPAVHKEIPPDPLPIKIGYQYFSLETRDDFWKKVTSSKNIAVYLPDKFPKLKVRLMAVRARE